MFDSAIKEETIIAQLIRYDGHRYTIYADGTHEGFEDIQFVFRRWLPYLYTRIAQALQDADERKMRQAASLSSQETITSNESSKSGGSQGSALPTNNVSGETEDKKGER